MENVWASDKATKPDSYAGGTCLNLGAELAVASSQEEGIGGRRLFPIRRRRAWAVTSSGATLGSYRPIRSYPTKLHRMSPSTEDCPRPISVIAKEKKHIATPLLDVTWWCHD
jgi:hypothetical protein